MEKISEPASGMIDECEYLVIVNQSKIGLEIRTE